MPLRPLVKAGALVALPLALALTAAPSFAASPAAAAATAAPDTAGRAQIAQKRTAVQGVSGDANAILAALAADPSLLQTLARNPEGGEALLRAHGATRAEHIAVTNEGGGAAKIKITITIDHVVITIELD